MELFRAADFDSGRQRFDLAQCCKCGFTRTSPKLTDPDLAAYYEPHYYGAGTRKFRPTLESLVQRGNRRRAGRMLAQLPQNAGRRRVLDIGCGRGGLLRALAEYGCECHGVERRDFPVPSGNDDIRYHFGAPHTLDCAPGSFDLIVLWHALEHLQEPVGTLRWAASRLRDGGVLALAVPNFASRQAHWFQADWFHLDLPRHLWHFRSEDLERICRPLGLRLRAATSRSLEQNPFGFLQSVLNRLLPGAPNRLYRAMHEPGRDRARRLAPWVLPAALLLPFALLEYLVSGDQRGAILIQYWQKDSQCWMRSASS